MRPVATPLACLLAAVHVAGSAVAETRFAASPGPDPAAPALVRAYDPRAQQVVEVAPYGSRHGANVAFADVDGSAKDQMLTGPGPVVAYGPHVRAFRIDGTAIPKVAFYAYGTLNHGVNVAGADLDLPAAMPTGVRDEIVTAPGPGAVFGPHVRGFSLGPAGLAAMPKVSFYAYGTPRYGAEVAGADVDGDLFEEILTVPGPSPAFGAHVKAFTLRTGSIQPVVSAILGTGRIAVSGGDVDGDGRAEILAGGAAPAGPRVRGFDYDNGALAANATLDFLAFPCTACGARPAAGRLDAGGDEEILAGSEGGAAVPAQLRGFDYDGTTVTPMPAVDVAPFPYAHGAKPAASDASYEFHPEFLWGTATAAHQVEGGNTRNDWYEWELLGNAPPSGAACEEYTRYDQDFLMSRALGHDAHRLSIEWSRIEPQRDVWDMAEVAHYHQVLQTMRSRGLEPMVTLHHFVTPSWIQSPLNPLADLDGWQSQATEDEFVELAAFCAAEFGAEVDLWVTLNEPVGLIFFGYLIPAFPPGYTFDIPKAQAAAEHMMFAHARGYDAIHAGDTVDADGDGVAAAVSIAQHTRWFLPADPGNPDDVFAASHFRYLANDLFFRAVVGGMLDRDWDGAYTSAGEGYRPELASRCDYVGVNYYGTFVVTYNASLPPLWGLPQENPDPTVPKSECGTEIYPQGLFRVMEGFHRDYGLPLVVTENGLCDADDDQRASYVTEHLRAMLRAEAHGATVTGYMHWSLLDNYEWVSGYGPKFGLLQVDFATQARTIRPSALVLQAIINANTVP